MKPNVFVISIWKCRSYIKFYNLFKHVCPVAPWNVNKSTFAIKILWISLCGSFMVELGFGFNQYQRNFSPWWQIWASLCRSGCADVSLSEYQIDRFHVTISIFEIKWSGYARLSIPRFLDNPQNTQARSGFTFAWVSDW